MNKTLHKTKAGWTIHYTLINISYFMAFCAIHAYASVFLLDKGFSNTLIGLCLAVANIVSVVVQPLIAGLIDKPGKLTNRNVAIASTFLLLVGSVLLLVIKNNIILIFIIFAFIYMLQMAYQPLIIAMNFEYAAAGCDIYFGLARGMGSAGFAVFSAIIGGIVEKHGVNSLLIADVFVLSVSILLLLLFIKPKKEQEIIGNEKGEVLNSNLWAFVKKYPKFMLFLVGVIMFFFAHNMINDYLIQIITPIGGNKKQMGYAIFIAALLELPTMALITVAIKKISCESLLKFSGIMFVVKTLILLLSNSMLWVYVSEACQMGAYAVLIPTAAYYVDKTISEHDRVKGQAFINCAITLAGFFSGLFCGKLLDSFGPKIMLLCGLIISVMGLVIVFIALVNKSPKKIG